MLLYYVFAPMMLVLGALFVWRHYRRQLATIRLRDARLLRAVPEVRIADAQSGVVKLRGRTEGPYSVMSYFDRVPCVAHRMLVDTYEGATRAGRAVTHRWRTSREWQLFPFQLNDGSGVVTIDPRGAVIDYEVCHTDEDSSVQEHCIRLNDTIVVVGRIEALPQQGYRNDGTAERIRFVEPPLVSWRSEPETLPVLTPPWFPTLLGTAGLFGIALAAFTGHAMELLVASACGVFAGGFGLIYMVRLDPTMLHRPRL